MSIPAGLWGIADGLRDVHAASVWARAALPCAAWTLRRPACGDRDAVGILRGWASADRFIAVHGRGDLARAGGAAAVLAGWRGLPTRELRRVHPALLVGVSVHGIGDARAALVDGADFLMLGPVWDTPSKRGLVAPRGLDELAAVAALGRPVVAVGGVQRPEQVAEAAAAGAHAVAVLRAAADATLCAELAAAYPSTKGPCTGLE